MKKLLTICVAVNFVLAGICTATEITIGNKLVIYKVKAITNKRILPDDTSIAGEVSNNLSVVAAIGEYEPASFVLRAKEDIEALQLEVDDLKTDNGRIIPASNIDIKVVKCWYQDEGLNYQEETPAKKYNPRMVARRRSGVFPVI